MKDAILGIICTAAVISRLFTLSDRVESLQDRITVLEARTNP